MTTTMKRLLFAAAVVALVIAAGFGAGWLEQQIDKNSVPIGGGPKYMHSTTAPAFDVHNDCP